MIDLNINYEGIALLFGILLMMGMCWIFALYDLISKLKERIEKLEEKGK